MSNKIFRHQKNFTLENGSVLPGYHLAYTTFGTLNEKRDNVVWIFHALTANSNPEEWWPGFVGEGCFFSPEKYFIVCVNMPGSCYGSTGPLDTNAAGEKYYHRFPKFTVRDMVHSYQHLREYLNIEKIFIGIGGSMGGQQLLEWAIEEPELFEYIVPLATNANHSQWGIAFNESQRWAIENDSSWKERKDDAGMEGMKAARSIALLSYRNYETYKSTKQQGADSKDGATYQRHQGDKLAKRFNAFSYWYLSKAMDSHDISRGRGSVEAALKKITAKALVIGISSDILFPISEQELLAEHIPYSKFAVIDSFYGHDGFLLEYETIGSLITNFIAQSEEKKQQDYDSYFKLKNNMAKLRAFYL